MTKDLAEDISMHISNLKIMAERMPQGMKRLVSCNTMPFNP